MKYQNQICYSNSWQLRYNTCTRGWQETGDYVEQGVLYESTGFSWGLDSVSLKFWYQVWYMKEHWNRTVVEETNVMIKHVNIESKIIIS